MAEALFPARARCRSARPDRRRRRTGRAGPACRAVAGLSLRGWALGAVLWASAQALGLLFARLRPTPDNLALAGAMGIGMMFRGAAVMVVAIAVAKLEPRGRRCGGRRLRARATRSRSPSRWAGTSVGCRGERRARPALAAPPLARGEFHPEEEFRLDPGSRSTSARSTCRSTRRSCTSLLGALLTICSGSASCAGGQLGLLRTRARRSARRLRHRPDADRRAGPALKGDQPLVPVRRLALPLHLGGEPARLHPSAVHRREVARDPRHGDLRGDVAALGDARARHFTFLFTHYEGIR